MGTATPRRGSGAPQLRLCASDSSYLYYRLSASDDGCYCFTDCSVVVSSLVVPPMNHWGLSLNHPVVVSTRNGQYHAVLCHTILRPQVTCLIDCADEFVLQQELPVGYSLVRKLSVEALNQSRRTDQNGFSVHEPGVL